MLKKVPLKYALCWSPLAAAGLLASCGGGSGPASPSIVSPDTQIQSTIETLAAVNTQSVVPANAANTLDAALACGLSNLQDEVLTRVNRARGGGRMCGNTFYNAVAPLTWSTNLFNAAAGHSNAMATTNFFSHTSLDGSSFAQRIADAGYTWSAIGENIAAGQNNIDDVFNVWLNSPGHCANIMSGNFSEIGLACVASASSMYSNYWTMDLGHR